VDLLPTPPYTPHRKGKIERVNRTLDQEFLSGLPFYTHGPRAADGHLFGPDAEPMSLELFSHRFAEWITDYNTRRVHSELDGQTPLVRWSEDATPLREVPAERLRWMLMADVERTVNKDGVHFERVRFIAPELNGLVGDRVQVRYTPHDLRQIEIFRGDQWLCTAYPQDQLTAEQRAAVLERRRADAAELGREQRRASRRARAQLAPITAPGPAEDTTVITPEPDRQEQRRRDDDGREMRRLGRTDLLGLHRDFDYWNPPREGQPDTPARAVEPAADEVLGLVVPVGVRLVGVEGRVIAGAAVGVFLGVGRRVLDELLDHHGPVAVALQRREVRLVALARPAPGAGVHGLLRGPDQHREGDQRGPGPERRSWQPRRSGSARPTTATAARPGRAVSRPPCCRPPSPALPRRCRCRGSRRCSGARLWAGSSGRRCALAATGGESWWRRSTPCCSG
jgi:hypothetical protein